MGSQDEPIIIRCSFCGKKEEHVRHMVDGPGVQICDECIDLSVEILAEKLSRKPGPAKALEKVESHLHPPGLRAAGRRLVRLAERHARGSAAPPVLLAGVSGTGKTTLLKAFQAESLLPVAVLDLAASPAEFTWYDLHPTFRQVILAAGGDLDRASRAVVVLENLDAPGSERLQWELLRILEGSRVGVPPLGGRPQPGQDFVGLETAGMFFVGVVRSETPDLIPPLAARFARRLRLHPPTLEDMLAAMEARDSAWSSLVALQPGSPPEWLVRAAAEVALTLQLGGWGQQHLVAALEEVLEEDGGRTLDAEALEEARTRLSLWT